MSREFELQQLAGLEGTRILGYESGRNVRGMRHNTACDIAALIAACCANADGPCSKDASLPRRARPLPRPRAPLLCHVCCSFMTKKDKARVSSAAVSQQTQAGLPKAGKKPGATPAQKRAKASSKETKASKATGAVAGGKTAKCAACKATSDKLTACSDCKRQLCKDCNINVGQWGSNTMCKRCSPATLGGERKPCATKCRHCGRKDGWVCHVCEDRICENCHSTPHCEICHETFLCEFCEDEHKDEVFCRVCARGLVVCERCCEGHDGYEYDMADDRMGWW